MGNSFDPISAEQAFVLVRSREAGLLYRSRLRKESRRYMYKRTGIRMDRFGRKNPAVRGSEAAGPEQRRGR
jgi:hypothetical protein